MEAQTSIAQLDRANTNLWDRMQDMMTAATFGLLSPLDLSLLEMEEFRNAYLNEELHAVTGSSRLETVLIVTALGNYDSDVGEMLGEALAVLLSDHVYYKTIQQLVNHKRDVLKGALVSTRGSKLARTLEVWTRSGHVMDGALLELLVTNADLNGDEEAYSKLRSDYGTQATHLFRGTGTLLGQLRI